MQELRMRPGREFQPPLEHKRVLLYTFYMLTKKNVVKVIDALEKEYPDAACALDYGTLYQLLVSVMLSAQTTDASVNKATPALFAAAPDAQSMVKLSEEEIQNYIRSIGLYKNKSKSLLAMSRQLLDRFGGEVPRDYDSLVSLPGVGRKTANVVLAEGFGQQQIAVDTHVFRLANRIGLTAEKNVLRTELGLQRAIPNDKWTLAHHALIFHGRRCCHARGPECGRCPINDVCEKNGVNDVQTL